MRGTAILMLGCCAQAMASPSGGHRDGLDGRRLDEVEIVGTHNSYHRRPDPALLDYLRTSGFADGPSWPGPKLARAIDYGHDALSRQLDQGVRALELDIHDDPQGMLFVHPPFLDALAESGMAPGEPWDPAGAMRTPGFKVLHKPAYDPRSNCPIFADCLSEIAAWSKAHADHAPIVLMIEVKADGKPDGPACAGLCSDGWQRLKRALSAAFGPSLLTPGEIGTQWPKLRDIRGRVMVMLLDDEAHARSYREETDRSGDDIVFTAARPGKRQPLRPGPHDRIAILPDPADPRIAEAHRLGLLVYTRADADTEEARANDTRRRDAAFASGATFISTDYPSPDRRFSDYEVRFADHAYVRCNPVTAPDRCARHPGDGSAAR